MPEPVISRFTHCGYAWDPSRFSAEWSAIVSWRRTYFPGAMVDGIVTVQELLFAISVSEAHVPGAGEPLMRPASSILLNRRAVLSTVVQSPLQEAR